ncbi:MAG: hypothetical protein ABIY50_13250, partial [Ignavibacteria bacterium]
MKLHVTIIFLCCALFTSCNKEEKTSEIGLIKSDQKEKKNNVSETNTAENKRNLDNSTLQIITAKEVKAHVGDSLTIKGFVADIYLSDKVIYLNFEKKFPKNSFSCAIFSNKFEEFGDVSIFKNKDVEVFG